MVYFFNALCAWFCWNQADKHSTWSGLWWFNVFASAANAAVVAGFFVGG